MRLTVGQCRAARALLNWTMGDLAKAASVGVMTINRFEGGKAVSVASIGAIALALEKAGISFIAVGEVSPSGGDGVRLVSPSQS